MTFQITTNREIAENLQSQFQTHIHEYRSFTLKSIEHHDQYNFSIVTFQLKKGCKLNYSDIFFIGRNLKY